MAIAIKRKRLIIGLLFAAAVLALGFALTWPVLAVRFGTPVMRQTVLYDWLNQRGKLSFLQKRVLLSLLYKKVDANAASMALPVLNAHLKEDEDEIVRHLAYIAFTSKDSTECAVALSGLKSVSAKHKEIAVSAFRYHLKNSDPDKKDDALKLVFAVSGLGKFLDRDALPGIESLTNHSNTFLTSTAKAAIAHLQGLDASPNEMPR
jgi:hypothetical protein